MVLPEFSGLVRTGALTARAGLDCYHPEEAVRAVHRLRGKKAAALLRKGASRQK